MILWLASCAMTEARFENVGFRRWCEQAENCDAQVDAAVCRETLRAQDRQGCVFDEQQAIQCHDALVRVTCRDVGVGINVIDVPESCDAVWQCDDLDGDDQP